MIFAYLATIDISHRQKTIGFKFAPVLRDMAGFPESHWRPFPQPVALREPVYHYFTFTFTLFHFHFPNQLLCVSLCITISLPMLGSPTQSSQASWETWQPSPPISSTNTYPDNSFFFPVPALPVRHCWPNLHNAFSTYAASLPSNFINTKLGSVNRPTLT